MSVTSGKTQSRARRLIATAVSLALLLALAAGLLGASGCDSSDTDTGTTSTTSTSPTSGATTSVSSPVTDTIYPGEAIYPSTTATTPEKMDKLVLVAPPGPMAIPMAYIAVNDKLAAVAQETELVIWENADQLRAIVSGKQGDFITMPSNNAALFHNRNAAIELLNISVWNITYIVTSDKDAKSLSDIKGQSLVISLQGSVPDVMFQYLAMKEGLDPEKDFKLRYVPDPAQAAQLLIAGEVDNAVLSEALATNVLLKTKDTERSLRKALAFDVAWNEANQREEDTPIAGTVAASSVLGRPDIIAAFEREYEAAVQWLLDDPEAAGMLVETELPELGLNAAIMTESLKSINWRYTTAADARWYLERFYGRLMELSPLVIGGQLPGDGFYYAP